MSEAFRCIALVKMQQDNIVEQLSFLEKMQAVTSEILHNQMSLGQSSLSTLAKAQGFQHPTVRPVEASTFQAPATAVSAEARDGSQELVPAPAADLGAKVDALIRKVDGFGSGLADVPPAPSFPPRGMGMAVLFACKQNVWQLRSFTARAGHMCSWFQSHWRIEHAENAHDFRTECLPFWKN